MTPLSTLLRLEHGEVFTNTGRPMQLTKITWVDQIHGAKALQDSRVDYHHSMNTTTDQMLASVDTASSLMSHAIM